MNFSPPETKRGPAREAQWSSLSPYLRQSCEPIRRWLQDPDVVEIMVNRPGEVWIEALGHPEMERFAAPELTAQSDHADRGAGGCRGQPVHQRGNAFAVGRDAARRAVPGGAGAGGGRRRRLFDPQTGDLRSRPRRLSRFWRARKCPGERSAYVARRRRFRSRARARRLAAGYEPGRDQDLSARRGAKRRDNGRLGGNLVGQDDLSQRAV